MCGSSIRSGVTFKIMADYKDITGQRFSMLTAIKYVGGRRWLFRCDCGIQKEIDSRGVFSGRTKSCGCWQAKNRLKYHPGQRFGSVVLIHPVGNGLWKLRCDCGKEFVSRIYPYKIGRNRTCGCSSHDGSKQIKHNCSRTETYHIWQGIKRRCCNPRYISFENYGGRGIKVCDRWLGEHGFENFLADMGERPGKEYSIDRIDVNSGYCPENCRWATRKEQANNTRRTVYLTHNGETHTLREWAEIYGIAQRTANERYHNGYSFEKIFQKGHISRILTDEEVRAVRKYNLTAASFFEHYGKKVSNGMLRLIKNHKSYKEIV